MLAGGCGMLDNQNVCFFKRLSESYDRLGFVTVPLGKAGNDKRPFGDAWQRTRRDADGSFTPKLDCSEPILRLGMLAGEANGGLLVFDFDDLATFEKVMRHPLLDGTALAEHVAKVPVARTAKGMHVFVRVAGPVPGSKRLAVRQQDGKQQVLVETRGEGGMVALPNTTKINDLDSAGRCWELLPRLDEIPIIDAELLDQFFALCHEFDELVQEVAEPANQWGEAQVSLCDAFNQDVAQQQRAVSILTASDFVIYRERDGAKYLTRSGRTGVVSASWGGRCRRKRDGVPMLRVFSSSSPWYSDKPLTPLDVVLRAEYGGDFEKLMAYIIQRYGEQPQVAQKDNKRANSGRFVLITSTADTEKLEPIEWLSKGVLPLGRATQLFSPGGTGKSSFLRRLIADLVKGSGMFCWLDGPCSVLSLIAEDSISQQMVPCLYAEGCTREQVARLHTAKGVVAGGGEPEPFSAKPGSLEALEDYLRANPTLKLVVVDPLAEFVSLAGLKMDSAEDARNSSGALHRIAERHNVAVLIVAHSVKSTEAKGGNRSSGSAQHAAAVRHMLEAERVGNDRMVIKVPKTNTGADLTRALACRRVQLDDESIDRIIRDNGIDPSLFSSPESRRAFSRQECRWFPLSQHQGGTAAHDDEDDAREAARVEKRRERNNRMAMLIVGHALSRPEHLDWPDVKALLSFKHPEFTELELEATFKALAHEGADLIADPAKSGMSRRFHHRDHDGLISGRDPGNSHPPLVA